MVHSKSTTNQHRRTPTTSTEKPAMVLRRLSISAKPPRYVPLPTKDSRYDDPPTHTTASSSSSSSTTNTTATTTNANTTSAINNISSNSSSSSTTLLPSKSFSSTSSSSLGDANELQYPPSPSSIDWWSKSVSSSISRIYRHLRYLLYTLVELGPTDKFIAHFRPRRFLIIIAFTSIISATLLLISFPFSPFSLPSISQWWLSSGSSYLDQEDAFRWNSIQFQADAAVRSQKQIPFLLNRFGYQSLPSAQSFSNSDPIPSILHVVPPGKGVFSYLQWLSISSGVKQIRPRRTMAHMIIGSVPPPGTNFWWDEIVRLPGFEIHHVEDPKEVFGNPILDISHKSDVIRLRALQEHGGVYIDTDVIVLRPFDELMTGDEEVVLGVEQAEGTFHNPVQINGLCNAVIISKKNATFLNTWWDNYRTFRGRPFRGGGIWNYHSVKLPWTLAKNASESNTPVTVLDHKSFFTPLWDDPALKWVHGTLQKPTGPPSSPAPVPPAKRPPMSNPEGTEGLQPPSSRFRMTLAELGRPLSGEYLPEKADDIEALQHGELAPDLPGFRLEWTGQFAYHMWHHLLDERISIATDGLLNSASDLSPEDTLNRDSSFNRVARKYLSPTVLKRYWNFKHSKQGSIPNSPSLNSKSTIPVPPSLHV
ncbi:hypothetical protein PtA15_2A530 [Puccinia triticina]|uniref:Alpha 1,4-glycosyltransferase domain-containing protein n=1 Tax=Puccinia triticina TaxID=208348 RepID=A0ABY7CCX0_9BASI|nr:uncharacterized protein PtA15_2A530 [Puccinia triticina]WAQ82213.1 hypothetical protein PtA15_2A530 [Puccinia triticina]